MDVRRHEWGNTKGRGTVVKMEVTDTSGDIQCSTFDGADELFARVKKGNVIQIPLAGAQIKNKNDKWNQTTHRFEIVLSAVASRGVRVLDDDDKLPRHNLQFTPTIRSQDSIRCLVSQICDEKKRPSIKGL